jgi:hypothetical protein
MNVPVIISPTLLVLFESLEFVLKINIDKGILNKMLDDARDDQVNQKRYRINSESDKLKIDAHVEAYEPEMAWLAIENITAKQNRELRTLITDYEFAFGSGASFRSFDESLGIFRRSREV